VISLTDYQGLKSKIIRLGALQRVPVLGEFELTSKCNFACPMCYVKDNKPKSELAKEEWISIFEEAVVEGLVYALLTGGEPLTRSDFVELYEFLYDYGVKITVYTNGYHLTKEQLEAFTNRPPEMVAITLYGASDDTYNIVTGIKDGYTKVTENILKLKKSKINIACRVIPIPEVYADLDDILKFIKENNIPLGYFLYLAPSKKKDYHGRLSPEQLVDFEQRLLTFKGKQKPSKDFDTLSSCAALKSGYAVNHRGYMQPCTLMAHPRKKLERGTFLTTFRELSDKWQNLEKSHDCESCDLSSSCIPCPARRYYEGDPHKCAPYLLEIAKERKKRND
jgi:radical SAM protein with 4Fe4S-binding SPASM domain